MSDKYNELTSEERRIIIDKGTERPFTGEYNDFSENGLYICRQCNSPLYKSEHKFQSSCGWPSFDDEIDGAIKRKIDSDGRRTEILCANCDGHLGHVFAGERLTENNIRHCVNSVSMKFISGEELNITANQIEKAYFAGGCFWGVEHLMQQQEGVISVASGYMGGKKENPTYQEVCSKQTGHIEAVEISYDSGLVSFEVLAKLFFEIHDPTQAGGQGPDIGSQYASAIFYNNEMERETALSLIEILKEKGYKVVTQLYPMSRFWPAEEYHQDYYQKNNKQPYCHSYQKKF